MDDVRASDAEREAAVARLRRAAADGRLDADELDERVAAAYRARTHGDLGALVRDLPEERPPGTSVARRSPQSLALRRRAAGALTASVIAVALWLATGHGAFWPQWVLLVAVLSLVGPLVRRVLKVDDDR
jgi:hypothetical protein